MKLSNAIQGFTISLRADGYAETTIDLYKYVLNRLTQYKGDVEISSISLDDLKKYMIFLQESKLAPSTIENHWKGIRTFYTWANADLGIERIDKDLKRPKYKAREIVPFTEDEIRKILRACTHTKKSETYRRRPFAMARATGYRDQAIVLLLLDTGLRVSELARLKVQDVNLDNGEVFIMPFSTGRKTKSRTVYIGETSRKAIWKYLTTREFALEDPLFLSTSGVPMNRNSIRHMTVNLGNRVGVANVTPHRFRHTFAIQFLRNGGNVFDLQRLLGHSTLEMSKHYVKLANTDIKKAHRRASPVDRWRL